MGVFVGMMAFGPFGSESCSLRGVLLGQGELEFRAGLVGFLQAAA